MIWVSYLVMAFAYVLLDFQNKKKINQKLNKLLED